MQTQCESISTLMHTHMLTRLSKNTQMHEYTYTHTITHKYIHLKTDRCESAGSQTRARAHTRTHRYTCKHISTPPKHKNTQGVKKENITANVVEHWVEG